MNVVSSETAKALEAAGFPVPDLCAGQMWHDGEIYYTIASVSESKRHIAGMLLSEYTDDGKDLDFHVSLMDNDVFCPSATDILREMPSDKSVCITYIDGEFLVSEFGIGPYEVPEFTEVTHKNPAEAMAIVWLELKLKK